MDTQTHHTPTCTFDRSDSLPSGSCQRPAAASPLTLTLTLTACPTTGGRVAVSHDLFDGALVVAGDAAAVDAFVATDIAGATVKPADANRGAQTALAAGPPSDDYAYALGTRATGGELRYPLYCACGVPTKYDDLPAALPQLGASLESPVDWRGAVGLMLGDEITHFVDAGGTTQLKSFMMKLSPQAALLMT